MRLLLVGAHGQVGQAIQALCQKQKIDCVAFGRQQIDITQPEQINQYLSTYVVDKTIIVNAAAYTAVDKAEDESELAYQVNRDAVANLAHFAKKHDIPLIHISTDYVFSGTQDSAYSENDSPNPTSVYGASKLAGEVALQEIWAKHIILRVSWVFGVYGKNFVKTIIRLAREQERLRIVADQHGNPTGAGHIAAVIVTIAKDLIKGKSTVWGTYHYCDAPSTTWHAFAETIVKMAQKDESVDFFPNQDFGVSLGAVSTAAQSIDDINEQRSAAATKDNDKSRSLERNRLKVREIQPITTGEFPTKAKRPANSRLNCGKIERIFGIHQSHWQDELQEVVNKAE